jgi:hypothetical protein
MHSSGPSNLFLGSATSFVLFLASFVPEVPPIAQWICLILSAAASILTIIKNSRK